MPKPKQCPRCERVHLPDHDDTKPCPGGCGYTARSFAPEDLVATGIIDMDAPGGPRAVDERDPAYEATVARMKKNYPQEFEPTTVSFRDIGKTGERHE
jgi:hypothetical protein